MLNLRNLAIKQTKDGLYSLNDLHKAAGLEGQGKRPTTYTDNLSDFKCSIYCIKKIQGGKQSGTYLNDLMEGYFKVEETPLNKQLLPLY